VREKLPPTEEKIGLERGALLLTFKRQNGLKRSHLSPKKSWKTSFPSIRPLVFLAIVSLPIDEVFHAQKVHAQSDVILLFLAEWRSQHS